MNSDEVPQLVERCIPRFRDAGLPAITAGDVARVQHTVAATLWAGMGSVFDIKITRKSESCELRVIAKYVRLPARCSSVGDQRKKASYAVEAAFYAQGHAQRLIAAGACVPFPLHIDTSRSCGVTICMTRLDGSSSCRGDSLAFVEWLAKLHAMYWGNARADAAVATGLQAQG